MSIASLPCTRPTSLEALHGEWEQLWRAARAAPFQSPAWLTPWWRHVGRGELASIAVRDDNDGGLIGLAPLYVFRSDDGVRHLLPIGIATTDGFDAIARPGREQEVAQAIAQEVRAMTSEWDVFHVPQLRGGALLLRCVRRSDVRPCDPHPVLALPPRVPAPMRKMLTYCRRRAAREGELAYELADANTVRHFVDTLAALHAKRWARLGQGGVLGEPGILAWHRDAAPRLLAHGLLRLIALRLDGRIIGVLYCLADGRRWYDYIGGFDPDFAALSPGTLLIGHAIDSAAAEGAAAFDFLRGAENYKYRWGAIDEAMFAFTVTRSPRPA